MVEAIFTFLPNYIIIILFVHAPVHDLLWEAGVFS